MRTAKYLEEMPILTRLMTEQGFDSVKALACAADLSEDKLQRALAGRHVLPLNDALKLVRVCKCHRDPALALKLLREIADRYQRNS